MEKLYVVVRADLPPAQQAVQGLHAARQLQEDHSSLERAWFKSSNTVALLQVDDEAELVALERQARMTGIAGAIFREPDLGDQATALALLGPGAKKLLRALPRALGGR